MSCSGNVDAMWYPSNAAKVDLSSVSGANMLPPKHDNNEKKTVR